MNLKAFYSLLLILRCLNITTKTIAQFPEGAKSAPTSTRANDCPCIFTDNRVLFKVVAPNATKVPLDLGNVCRASTSRICFGSEQLSFMAALIATLRSSAYHWAILGCNRKSLHGFNAAFIEA